METDDVVDRAQQLAREYISGLARRPVGGADAPGLRRPLTDEGLDPIEVLEDLAADADAGLVASAGPRYFGFVVGGSLPVATGADWLVSAWDQMSGMYSSSPAVAIAEEVTAAWMLELLGLPALASSGFTTGAQMANFTCLAAARGALLGALGWDVEDRGLFGAPEIDVLVGDEVHVTVLVALRLLGLGEARVTRVPVDANGAMDPGALREALPPAGARYSCARRRATSTRVRVTRWSRSPRSWPSAGAGSTSMAPSACGPQPRPDSPTSWPVASGPTRGRSMPTSGSTCPTTARWRSSVTPRPTGER